MNKRLITPAGTHESLQHTHTPVSHTMWRALHCYIAPLHPHNCNGLYALTPPLHCLRLGYSQLWSPLIFNTYFIPPFAIGPPYLRIWHSCMSFSSLQTLRPVYLFHVCRSPSCKKNDPWKWLKLSELTLYAQQHQQLLCLRSMAEMYLQYQ